MLRQVPYERIQGLQNLQQGLDEGSVESRRNRFGANHIVDQAPGKWKELALETLRDPMLWFLIITSSIFAGIGETKEAIILAIALIPLAGMDLFLHQRTQASTASLGGKLATQSTVIRNGSATIIASHEIVCGDLVVLNANESLPADGIIIDVQDIQIDESALTGEAFPVRKKPFTFPTSFNDQIDGKAAGIDTVHWGFAGTRCLTGTAKLRVIYTGADTYYGEIVQSALQGRHDKTPLQVAIGNLVTVLLVIASIICLIVAWVRWSQGFGLLDALVSAMTLAVAALPEEFPVVFTFFLGMGVYRLAKRRALVRRAVAVENIGRITTICSDKTGTLTQGRLTLTHIYPAPTSDEKRVLYLANLASRSESGDPMDEAIIEANSAYRDTPLRFFSYPFTEDRKKETAIIRQHDNQLLTAVKGAPEVILNQCKLADDEAKQFLDQANTLAMQGHKVIACAQLTMDEKDWTNHEPDTDFEFAGLLALEDPVRDGVAESVHLCQQAGIHIIMITGDHPLTACAVANEIGLGNGNPVVMTAEQLQSHLFDTNSMSLHEVDVIARSIPSQKLHFVRQLQAMGEIVSDRKSVV